MKPFLFLIVAFVAISFIPDSFGAVFSNNNPTEDGYIVDSDNSDACDFASSRGSADTVIGPRLYDSTNPSLDCLRGYAEWDISAIPDDATISEILFIFEITSVSNARTCSITPMNSQPSVISDAALFTDIGDGTPYVSNDSFCQTIGTSKSVSLGAAAIADMEAALTAGDYFALGFKVHDETLDTLDHYGLIFSEESSSMPDPTIQVTYNIVTPPDPINDLSVDEVFESSADLSWTQPNLNGHTLINYIINQTSPHGNPLTFSANTTGTSYSVTGLSAGTQYSFRVTAFTSGGVDATGNIANTTTTTYSVPGAPTLGANALSSSSVRFTSAAGSIGSNATIWYGFQCELNGSGTWDTVVANSSLPSDRNYEYTGLDPDDVLICQWRDGSVDGWSVWSNNATDFLLLDIIRSERASNATDKLKELDDFVSDQGGLWFGLGLFPFITMLVGFMAGKKTVRIFTLIVLSLMGILHASGYFVYPDWYWTLSLLLGFVLIMGRQRSD